MTATTPGAGTDVRAQVYEIISARTLYDTELLQPDSELEADLGIDSVILESILLTLEEEFGVEAQDAVLVTIGDLVELVAGTASARPAPTPTPAAPAGVVPPDLLDAALLTATVRATRYRPEQLPPDADIEGDLGIDSVVLIGIVADVAQTLSLPESVVDEVRGRTLAEIAASLRKHVPGSAGPAPGAPADDAAPAPEPQRPTSASAAAPSAAPAAWDGRSMKDFAEQRDRDLFAKTRTFGRHLRDREAAELYWYGMPLQSRCGNRAVIRDQLTGRTREYLMFASNNYLGLANHPKVIEAICDATRVYGATNTGCRLIGGTNVLHTELERRLAAMKGRPAAIVYPGGYSANLGAISALVGSSDAIVVDKYNHMSIVDGAKLSGAMRRIYRHNDMTDLRRVLERCSSTVPGGVLIAVDGVFSMHGDIAPLPEICALAEEFGARVLIDDAHATGVLGARGTGTAEHFGLKGRVDLELGTMSKTLAGMGGFVVGEQEVVDYLRFYSDSYVFAATIPAGTAAGLIAALDIMEAEPDRLARLWANVRWLSDGLTRAGFDLERTESAILPIVVGDERTTLEMGRAVRARGLFCQTVVFPGVAVGDARLRVSVTSEHTAEDLAEALDVFVSAGREVGVLDRLPAGELHAASGAR